MGCTLVHFTAVISLIFLSLASTRALAQGQIVQGEYIVKMKVQSGASSNQRLSESLFNRNTRS